MSNAYKSLKAALRNPVIVHASSSENKPHYLKMTFSMCRNAVNGERFLEMSKLKELTMGKSKQTGPTGTLSDISSILGGGGSRDGKSLALSNSK